MPRDAIGYSPEGQSHYSRAQDNNLQPSGLQPGRIVIVWRAQKLQVKRVNGANQATKYNLFVDRSQQPAAFPHTEPASRHDKILETASQPSAQEDLGVTASCEYQSHWLFGWLQPDPQDLILFFSFLQAEVQDIRRSLSWARAFQADQYGFLDVISVVFFYIKVGDSDFTFTKQVELSKCVMLSRVWLSTSLASRATSVQQAAFGDLAACPPKKTCMETWSWEARKQDKAVWWSGFMVEGRAHNITKSLSRKEKGQPSHFWARSWWTLV